MLLANFTTSLSATLYTAISGIYRFKELKNSIKFALVLGEVTVNPSITSSVMSALSNIRMPNIARRFLLSLAAAIFFKYSALIFVLINSLVVFLFSFIGYIFLPFKAVII